MQGFDALNPPFDRLTRAETEALRAAVDIGYFAPGSVIVERGGSSEFLHVIIKGSVAEKNGEETVALLGSKDTFDSEAVVHGSASGSFVAVEETLCYLLPRLLILELVQKNQAFAAFFYSELSRRLDAFAENRNPSGLESVLRLRVKEARCADAIFIDGASTIEKAGHTMAELNNDTLFVSDAGRTGIVTGMNLAKAVILRRLPLETPVRDICHFDIAAVDGNDFLFDALIAMTRRGKRRIAVRAEGAYAGVLEDIAFLELFAGNSQLIPGRIDRAKTVADLTACAADIQGQVLRLHEQGVKVEVIADITSDLNRELMSKIYELTAPPSIKEQGCLLVMGSEGRGEQTVRTDQDNGLLLAAPVPEKDIVQFRKAFTESLEACGFPPCPGNVMVRNPVWSQPADDFIKQLKSWILTGGGDAAMNLGIFCDAAAIAGRSDLLLRAKTAFMEMMQGESAHLAHFANLIDLFASSDIGTFGTLMVSVGARSDAVDIKKVGTFPIVHGTRTLAIEKGIFETSTADRINAIAATRIYDADFAKNLISALHFFMELRLRSQLKARRLGNLQGESVVHMNELSSADRDILRNAIRVVREFREIVRHRFHLGVFLMVARTLRRLFHQASIGDQSYRFLFKRPPPGEAVSIDCETTGLNIAKDDIITIAAVRIKGDRILTSEAFEVLVRPEAKIAPDAMKIHQLREADVEQEQPIRKVLRDLLYFIGSRPLVGYYLDFDIAMLDKHVLPFIQIGLPNKRIEVSELYYERKYGNAPPGTTLDLRFTAILQDLGLPNLGQHDALNDALMTAMIYVILRDMRKRGARILRDRERPLHHHGMGA